MSKESVEAIVGKAVLDGEFREALFASPEEVLSEYELTDEEVGALRAIDFETMESFAGTLDERISKMSFGHLLFDTWANLQAGLDGALSEEMQPDLGDAAGGDKPDFTGSGGGGSIQLAR
jgi:hypothetical protein